LTDDASQGPNHPDIIFGELVFRVILTAHPSHPTFSHRIVDILSLRTSE
jgi:hypothetical protein